MAVSKRDDPEPAVFEPIHAYVTFFFSFPPDNVIKVREERSAFMMSISDLYAEPVGQERVSTGCIYEKPRLPGEVGSRRITTSDFDAAICAKLNGCGPHPLVHRDACSLGILEEYLVELGALHLKCSWRLGIKCVRELNRYMPAVARKTEVSTSLNDPDARDFVHNPKLIKDRQIAG
jgi:hypothetical protein